MTDEPHARTDETDETRAHTDGTADPPANADGADADGANADAYGGYDAHAHTAPDAAYVCTDCDERWFYARARCPDCGGGDHATYELGVGTLRAATTARVTPADVRDENPLGLAEFGGGVTVLAQLPTGERRPDVGDAVELTGSSALRDGVYGARLHGVGEDAPTGAGDERVRRREVRES